MVLDDPDAAVVQSDVDRLVHGRTTAARVQAARALGCLHLLASAGRRGNASKLALELGVFDALQQVLCEEQAPAELLTAVHVALSRLFNPAQAEPGAWLALQKGARVLLQEHVLTFVAATLKGRCSTDAVSAIASWLAGIAKHCLPRDAPVFVDHSQLVEAVLYRISTAQGHEGVVCGEAAMQLALASGSMFQAIVSTNGRSRSDSPANLYAALSGLYSNSIDPDVEYSVQRMGEVQPSDVAQLFLKAATLQPWLRHADISKESAEKVMLDGLLDSNAFSCWLSYLVVEIGNVRHKVVGTCSRAVQALQEVQEWDQVQLAQGRQALGAVSREKEQLKVRLADAQQQGRLQESWAMQAFAQAQDTQQSGLLLRDDLRGLSRHLHQAADRARSDLQAWASSNHKQQPSKVKRGPPNTALMSQVLDTLCQLVNPPVAQAAASSKQLNPALRQLQHDAQQLLLSCGLLPAVVQVHKTTQAVLHCCQHFATFLNETQLVSFTHGRCRQLLVGLKHGRGQVEGLAGRVQIRLRQARDESVRMQRRLHAATLQDAWQGNDIQCVQEQALTLAQELVDLAQCDQALQGLAQDYGHYINVLMEKCQQLEAAGAAAAKLLLKSKGLSTRSPRTSLDASPSLHQMPSDMAHDAQGALCGTDGDGLKAFSQPPVPGMGPVCAAHMQQLLSTFVPVMAAQLSNSSINNSQPVSTGVQADGPPAVVQKALKQEDSCIQNTAGRSGCNPNVRDVALLELQLHSLWEVIAGAQLLLDSTTRSNAQATAWRQFRSHCVTAELACILPAALRFPYPLKPSRPAITPITPEEYHSLHELDGQDVQLLRNFLPRMYYTWYAVQQYWHVAGVTSVDVKKACAAHAAVQAAGQEDKPDGIRMSSMAPSIKAMLQPVGEDSSSDVSFPLRQVYDPKQEPATGNAGAFERPLSAGARPYRVNAATVPGLAKQRPNSARSVHARAAAWPGAAAAGLLSPRDQKASPQSKVLSSSYLDIIHTMSPTRGCMPRLSGEWISSNKCANQDEHLLSLPLAEQCNAIIQYTCTSLLDTLGAAVPETAAKPGNMAQAGIDAERSFVPAGAVVGDDDGLAGTLPRGAVQWWAALRSTQTDVINLLVKQASDLTDALQGLHQLASLMKATNRRGCLLPCSITCSWQSVAPDHLHRWMAPLVTALCSSLPVHGSKQAVISSRAKKAMASQQQAVLTALTQAAMQGVTSPAEFQSVYVDSGLISKALQLLSAAPPAPPQDSSAALGKAATKVNSPANPSRYDVGTSPVPRPDAAGAAVQAAAARWLVVVGALHPAALTSITASTEAPPHLIRDIISLGSDHSMPLQHRLRMALLLADVCTLPTRAHSETDIGFGLETSPPGSSLNSPRSPTTPLRRSTRSTRIHAAKAGRRDDTETIAVQAVEARGAVLRAGAFAVFQDIMVSDHRHMDPDGCKPAVADALVDILMNEQLCELIMDAAPPDTSTPAYGLTAEASAASARSLSTCKQRDAKGCPLAKARAVHLFPRFETPEEVMMAALRALWEPSRQLYVLMSSDRTKQGRTVNPDVVAALNSVCLHTVKCLGYVAEESMEARRLLQAMGVGKAINNNFLQAVKDVQLHQGLLQLKESVGVRKKQADD